MKYIHEFEIRDTVIHIAMLEMERTSARYSRVQLRFAMIVLLRYSGGQWIASFSSNLLQTDILIHNHRRIVHYLRILLVSRNKYSGKMQSGQTPRAVQTGMDDYFSFHSTRGIKQTRQSHWETKAIHSKSVLLCERSELVEMRCKETRKMDETESISSFDETINATLFKW